jgi:hypothetical protein
VIRVGNGSNLTAGFYNRHIFKIYLFLQSFPQFTLPLSINSPSWQLPLYCIHLPLACKMFI